MHHENVSELGWKEAFSLFSSKSEPIAASSSMKRWIGGPMRAWMQKTMYVGKAPAYAQSSAGQRRVRNGGVH